MTSMTLQVIHSVAEVDPSVWDGLSLGRPFSSHRWYRFGETVMQDCLPVYILIWQQEKLLARATFWEVRSEPVPIASLPLRAVVQALLKRRPLFTCRSPLANSGGLVLPASPLRSEALEMINQAALAEARKAKASFILYDFFDQEQSQWKEWQKPFSAYTFSDPGTAAEVTWADFEAYLASLTAKERKHYRQRQRMAETLGITMGCSTSVTDIDEALPLIRLVEQRHQSSPNPWVRRMFTHMDMVESTWITARIQGRLVGCELVLGEGTDLMVTALGLAPGISDVYHLLGYADIGWVIQRGKPGARRLHWGSGAYETKRRLGFGLEYNNYVTFCGLDPFSRWVARLAEA